MMPIAKYLLLGAVILGLVSGIVACAARSHGVVLVPRSYDEVFAASLAAIQEAEFTVTSQERDTGTIGAEKRLPRAEGDILRMTVRLTQAQTGVTVVATVVPPTGPLAAGEKPCKCHVKRFVEALEHRMPEVQVETIQ
jgi:S-adenosylmethionine synthetase